MNTTDQDETQHPSHISHHLNRLLAKMEQRRQFPLVKFADGFYVIDHEGDGQNFYEINAKRIDTPGKLIAWQQQLAGKKWFTMDHLQSLNTMVCNHLGIQIEHGA